MDGLRPAPPEIIAVVGRLIAAHFPHLATARLAVLVRDKAVDAGNEQVSVAATGANTDDASLPFEYVIWFALDAWQLMSEADREAIVYHELTHCSS